ncbi:MAG: DUF2255 family protein [Microbacterium sp.]|uniref:DUF2255 family protein n=1 Tax=Microbacterium sp. TaxID=51671 RepID=UPI003A88ABD0
MSYQDTVKLLDDTQVVAIVTTKKDGSALATPIWSMVIDGVPYVRSAYGASSWWHRHIASGRPVSFARGDGALAERDRAAALDLPREAVSTAHVPADDPVQRRIDDEIQRKYASSQQSSIDAMLSPEAVACTLRIGPPVTT